MSKLPKIKLFNLINEKWILKTRGTVKGLVKEK